MASTGINFTGTAANESIDGGELNDTLDGAGGNDTLRGFGGNDSLLGSDGNDSILGGNGQDSLYGGKGNDTLFGEFGDDWLDAGAGDDLINGAAGADTVLASGGADTIDGGAVGDIFLGDRNRLSFQDFTTAVLVDLMAGTAASAAGNLLLSNIHIVVGGTGNDTLLGFQRSLSFNLEQIDIVEEFAPGAGNDSVDGRGGLDILRYDLTGASAVVVDLAAGTAVNDGQGGSDVFTNIEAVYGTAGDDSLTGSNRTDVAETFRGGAGIDTIDGRNGQDIVDYSYAAFGVHVNIAAGVGNDGSGANDQLIAIEGVIGSAFDDTIIGATSIGATLFESGAGNDSIDASAGDDDEVSYYHSPYDGVNVDLSADRAWGDGWGNQDTLIGIEHVTGSLYFSDTIYGSAAANRLSGLGGSDTMHGWLGSDTLIGGSGADELWGDDGDDLLYGDDGIDASDDFHTDSLYGGDGNDTLKPGSYDWVNAGAGDDLIIGPTDVSLDYSDSPAPIHVMLQDVTLGVDGLVIDGHMGLDSIADVDTVRLERVVVYASPFGDSLEGATAPLFDYDAAWRATDQFYAGSGNDTILGRGGYDTLYGEFGDDNIDGGEDSDWLDGGDGNDYVFGGNNEDTVLGGYGIDTYDGGLGQDMLSYEYSSLFSVIVDAAIGEVAKSDGNTDVYTGFESITGSNGPDQFNGSPATEQFQGGGGNDTFFGSGGVDVLSYQNAYGGIVAVLPADPGTPGSIADGRGGVDQVWLLSAEQLFGGFYDDSITGAPLGIFGPDTVGHDSIWAGWGNDTVRGLSGDDFLSGEYGNDSVAGGAGNDTLWGGEGDDLLAPGPGSDSVDGGNGFDILDYSDYTSGGVSIQLGPQTADKIAAGDIVISDLIAGIEGAIGTSFPDNFTGSSGPNSFMGLGGNDFFAGSAGVDILRYDDATLATGVVVTLPSTSVPGSASDGHGGTDMIQLGAAEVVIGSAFADSITGANVTVFGADAVGHDTLIGGNGNDTLSGLGGNDSLAGGNGDDRLVAGSGLDTLNGGSGNDLAVTSFARSAAVIELVSGNLRVNRSGIDTLLLQQEDGQPTVENVQFSDQTVSYAVLLAQVGVFLTGTEGNDTLIGGVGWDSIVGQTGADRLFGNAGNDTLVAGSGADYADGGDGTDLATLPFPLAQYIVSRIGDDLLLTRGGDSLLLLANVENVQFSDVTRSFAQLVPPSGLTLNGTPGDDTLTGGTGHDTLNGLAGNDRLDALAGNDRLDGGDGDDLLIPGLGNDSLIGGAGLDIASYAGLGGAIVVDLGATTVTKPGAGTDLLTGVEGVIGTAFADRFTGDAADNVFIGGAGNDVFVGSPGIDLLSFDDLEIPANTGITLILPNAPGNTGTALDGRGGVDTILLGAAERVLGSAGPDSIGGAPLGQFDSITVGHDTLMGGEGNDTLRGFSGDDSLLGGDDNDLLIPGDGVDTVIGGAGNDTLQMTLARGAYSVRKVGSDFLLVRGSDSVLLQQIEQVQFADTLLGIAALDAFVDIVATGTPGADTLSGGPGNDTLTGLAGDDLLRPGPGNDSVDGGQGFDTVDFATLTGSVVVELGLQRSTNEPGGGSDVLLAIEAVRGSGFADRLVGDGADNRLEGGAGNDTLEGAAGDDTLLGGDGNDTLITGIGSDSLDGGAGADTVQLASGLAGWIATLIGDDLLLTRSGGFTAQAAAIGGAVPSVRPSAGGADSVLLQGIEQVRFSDATLSFEQLVQTVARNVGGTPGRDTLDGGNGNDTLRGGGDNDVLVDSPGSDSLDGGEGLDIAAFTGFDPVAVNLAEGSATRGPDSDILTAIEAVFGGDGNDTLRGANAPDNQRDDTLRGRGGNDSLDGASGNDSAEWIGPRSDYTVTRIAPGSWQVRDDNPANGSEGIDTVTHIERLVFADRMLSVGQRAEELARVAFVLWSPAIVSSGALFSRGLSFYDVGYDFETLSVVALQFWTGENDEQLAQRLISNSGSTKSVAQLLQTMAAAGPGIPGRAAAVRDIALDAATTTLIEQSGIRETGLASDHFVPGFGSLFGLLPGG